MAEPVHKLKDERGIVFDVPESELHHAQSAMGLTPATEEDISRHQRSEKFSGVGEKLKALAVAGARVPTLGLSDYLIDPKYLRDLEEELPLLTGATEVVGTIGAAVGSGGTSLLARGLAGGTGLAFRTAGGLGKALTKKLGGKRLAQLAGAGLREGIEGAAFGAMQGVKQSAMEEADFERAGANVISSAWHGAKVGAAFGAGIGAAGLATRAVGRGIGQGVSKASAKAFAELENWAPGPAGAFGNIVERATRSFERTTGRSGDPIRRIMRSDELIQGALNRAEPWSLELGDLLRRNMDESIETADALSALSRAEGKEPIIHSLLKNFDDDIARVDKELADLMGQTPWPQGWQARRAKLKAELEELAEVRGQLITQSDALLDGAENQLLPFGTWGTNKTGGRVFKPNEYALSAFKAPFWKLISSNITYATSGARRIALAEKYGLTSSRAIALDSLKKGSMAGKVSKEIQYSMEAHGNKGKVARALNDEYLQPIRRFLEDDAWGDFAKWQQMSNASWVVLSGVKDHIGKLTYRLGKKEATDFWSDIVHADPRAVDALVKMIGAPGGDVSADILKELARHWREKANAALFLKTKPAVGKLVSSETFEQAKKLRDASEKILKALNNQSEDSLFSKIYAVRKFEEFSKNDQRFLGGLPGQAAIGIGIATGSPLAYGLLRTGQAIGDLAVSPGRTVKALGGAYLAAKKLKATDSKFIKKIFSGAKKAPGVGAKKARRVGPALATGANFSLVNMTADQDLYEREVSSLRGVLGDIDRHDEAAQDIMAASGIAAADLQAIVLTKRTLIREYLLMISPTPEANPTVMGRKRPVSKMEAQRFAKVKRILENPKDASKLLSEGKMTSDQAKALRTVWPAIYADLQDLAMEEMAKLGEEGKTIPYQKRIQIGILLQLPTDPTLDYKLIRGIQIGYSQKKAQPQPPQQRRAPKLNRAVMSESERTEEGTK